MDVDTPGLLSLLLVALATSCGAPSPGASATTATASATSTGATSSSSGEASTTTTTTATTTTVGETTSSSSTTYGELEPMDCPEEQVFVCRIDPSGECGSASSCIDLDKYCDLGVCSTTCEWDCGIGWDCVDAGTTEMLVCARDYTAHCDPWNSDCPEGTKCTTGSTDGDGWNARVCAPVDPDPVGPGEACVLEDWITGIDNCDAASMCFDDICVPFCEGPIRMPTCPPASSCTITAESIINLCLPWCDPLAQDCGDSFQCIPSAEGFYCAFAGNGEQKLYGDPCEYVDDCAPGLFCLETKHVPDCEAASCCSPFCDLSAPNTCPGVGQTCMTYFEPGQAPPGFDNAGYCGIEG